MYHGDIRLGETLDLKFTTRRFTTGAPFTLAGSPVISAYVGNSTTEITAGITLTVDFDSRTGLNHVRVVATSGNGYATASNYELVITTGTVDSVSVVGEVVASFSIEARSVASVAGSVGSVTGNVNGQVASIAPGGITMPAYSLGETKPLLTANSGDFGFHVAGKKITVPSGGWKIQGITAGVNLPVGTHRFALYDAANAGKPQTLIAETASTTATGPGRQYIPVVTPVICPAGDYWIAFQVSANGHENRKTAGVAGSTYYYSTGAYGAFDATFNASPTSDTEVFELSATFDFEDETSLRLMDLQSRLPTALVSGKMDSNVGAISSGAITAASIATGAIDADAIASDAVTEIQAGLATQASVDDLPTNAELSTALAAADDAMLAQIALVKAKTDNLPTDPADASDITAQFAALTTLVNDIPTNAEIGTALDVVPTAAENADAVWDEALAGHLSAGSTGEALDSAGSGGSAPTVAQIADGILDRHLAGGSNATGSEARSVRNALRSLRNKSAIVSGTLTVREEDDSTAAWTAIVTTAPGDPLTSIDPA